VISLRSGLLPVGDVSGAFRIGSGVTNYLAVPDLPLDTRAQAYDPPGGAITNSNIGSVQPHRRCRLGRWHRCSSIFTGERASEVLLIGMTGEQSETGTRLSKAAQDGATQAINAVSTELDFLGAHYSKQIAPSTVPAWWEPVEEAPSAAA
jgi:hypothetical protein